MKFTKFFVIAALTALPLAANADLADDKMGDARGLGGYVNVLIEKGLINADVRDASYWTQVKAVITAYHGIKSAAAAGPEYETALKEIYKDEGGTKYTKFTGSQTATVFDLSGIANQLKENRNVDANIDLLKTAITRCFGTSDALDARYPNLDKSPYPNPCNQLVLDIRTAVFQNVINALSLDSTVKTYMDRVN